MFNSDPIEEFGNPASTAVRIFWILFSMLFLPAIMLKICNSSPMALLISSGFGVLGGIAPAKKLMLKKINFQDLLSIACTVVIILFSVAILTACWKFILTTMHISYPEKQFLAKLISETNWQGRAMVFCATCLFAPFSEEVLFRRIIYGIWQKHHPQSAFIGTAIVFSLIHFFLPGIPGLFFMGIAFQYIFLRRKNLWCAYLTHFFVNVCAFIVNI